MFIKFKACGPLNVNAYVVFNSPENAIVIDPASDSFVNEIINEFSLDLKAILLTHGHFDHIWKLRELKERFPDAIVYINSLDSELLSDNEKNCYIPFGGKIARNFGCADRFFKDGEIIDFGNIKVKAISTPGHSKGSSVFLIEDSLFSGDTLFKSSCGRTDLYGGSENELSDSLMKLKNILVENGDLTVYPGHGETASLKQELSRYFTLL